MEIDLTGILILFAAVIFSRMISQNAEKYLSDSEKLGFSESFSGIRKYSLVPLAAILVFFIITYKFLKNYREMMLIVYFSLLILYVLSLNLWMYFRLRKLNLNAKYMQSYLLSRLIPFAGIIVFAVLLAMKTLGQK